MNLPASLRSIDDCLMCKPHKANGAKKPDPPAARRRMQVVGA
jgi:hypothetical protein